MSDDISSALAATAQTDQDIISPRLHHAFLKTTRLQEMKNWYALTIGMKPHFEWDSGAFMGNDHANHRLVIFTSPAISDDPDKVQRAGLHHLAFEYDHCDDLVATYRRLQRHGIVPHAALDHGLTTSFYYLDPDGNSLELQYDNFGDWEKSTEFIRTSPAFADEPIGHPVDPEAFARAQEAGRSVDALHRDAYAGKFAPSTPQDIRIPG